VSLKKVGGKKEVKYTCGQKYLFYKVLQERNIVTWT